MLFKEYLAKAKADTKFVQDFSGTVSVSKSDIAHTVRHVGSFDLSKGRKMRLTSAVGHLLEEGNIRFSSKTIAALADAIDMAPDEEEEDDDYTAMAAVTVGGVAVVIAAIGLGIVVGNLAEDYFNDDEGGESEGEGRDLDIKAEGNGDVDVSVPG